MPCVYLPGPAPAVTVANTRIGCAMMSSSRIGLNTVLTIEETVVVLLPPPAHLPAQRPEAQISTLIDLKGQAHHNCVRGTHRHIEKT
jgi:hypothetical protein